MNWKEYPDELIKGRESAEATFIFCLWKQPDLYDDFPRVNATDDETLKTEDGIFYFSLGRQMFNQGFRSFDNVTIYTFLENKPTVKKHFDELGGYKTVSELCSLVNVENIDAYYDKIAKMNTLMTLYDKGFNVLPNIDRFAKMTNQEVYDYYDYILNSVSIKNTHDIDIETLEIDDKFLNECNDGSAQGISYGKNCPILNYLTLGTPLGDMYMFAGHSGVGKTSFVFENMIIPMTDDGVKCAVISNEQRSKDFKQLLLVHILTNDLDYWGLTRKKLKMGKFTDEQWEYLRKAKQISREKYSNIQFVKLFDNDKYLYMDDNHRITFNNGVTDLQIRMDENFNILCRNLSFPDVPESYFSSELVPAYCLGVIQLLQNMPPEEHPKHFKNRWEEIKDITMINLSLNRK